MSGAHYWRVFIVLFGGGAVAAALTLPAIVDSAVQGRLLTVLAVASAAAMVLGLTDTVPVGHSIPLWSRRRAVSLSCGLVLAVTLAAVLASTSRVPQGAAAGSWCASVMLGMSTGVAYRLIHHARDQRAAGGAAGRLRGPAHPWDPPPRPRS